MTPEPLFPEDQLRAHLQTAPDTAPDPAWVRAVCAGARRTPQATPGVRLAAAAAVVLLLTIIAAIGLRLFAPMLAPVLDAALTCGRTLWAFAQGAPPLLADTARQLAFAPFTPWLLLSLLAVELGAIAIINRHSPSRHA
jgi:hypothetical protein